MTLSPIMRSAIVLGLLSAVGPFAIDMFLPALPAIAADLDATVAQTQGTIIFYFIAFGLAQLIYGPLSDQSGRKVPIYIGLFLFGVGSILATVSGTIGMLVFARLIQGLGAASLMVVTRAIIRDQYTGYEATRLMALIMLVFSVSPMFAPLAGAGLIAVTGWRAIFGAMAIAAVLAALITAFLQKETLPQAARVPVNLRSMGRGLRVLMTDPVFLGLTFVGGFGMAGFFIFIASASFVYTDTYGFTPTQFSFAFTANAMGFIGASQAAAPLMRKHGVHKIIMGGVIGFAVSMVALTALFSVGASSVWLLIGAMCVGFGFMGLVIPTTMVAALDDHGDIAGLASSLGGTLQMLAGGIMVALTGPFFDGTPLPMLASMATCALITLGLCLVTLPKARARMSV